MWGNTFRPTAFGGKIEEKVYVGLLFGLLPGRPGTLSLPQKRAWDHNRTDQLIFIIMAKVTISTEELRRSIILDGTIARIHQHGIDFEILTIP
jgi:hypothetical protein